MSYLHELKQKIADKNAKEGPAKPAEGSFAGSAGSYQANIAENSLPTELDRLIGDVGAYYNFPPDELQLAKDIAAGDLENATRFYRYASARIRREQ